MSSPVKNSKDNLLLNFIAILSDWLHTLCIENAPYEEYRIVYTALVCGQRLPPSLFKDIMTSASLIHLMVVSGAHLLVLEAMLSKILARSRKSLLSKILLFTCLFGFVLITNMQAPATRAFVSLIIRSFSQRNKLFWNAEKICFWAGLVTLLFIPEWVESFSFMLSWGASLAIASSQCLFSKSNLLIRNTIIYILLLPFLVQLSIPHPLSILCNTLLGPILSQLLFPITLLGYFVPLVRPLVDLLLSSIEWTLLTIHPYLPFASVKVNHFPIKWLWGYLIGLHFVLHIVNIWQSSFKFNLKKVDLN